MATFGICPKCGFETELNNVNVNYCMCQECKTVYNISHHAKIQGTIIGEHAQNELRKLIEAEANHIISNWRYE